MRESKNQKTTVMPLSWATSLLVVVMIIAISCTKVLAQVSDGDEQFQAYHQDIGRISGSNGAQVAPQTTIVERGQSQLQGGGEQINESSAPPPLPPVAAAPQQQVATQQQQRSPARLTTGSRKPNRITLVARRDPLPSASAALAPIVSAASPQANNNQHAQNGEQFHHQNHRQINHNQQLQQPQSQQPSSQHHSHNHHSHTHQEAPSFSGPALASFRNTAAAALPVPLVVANTSPIGSGGGVGGGTVSARHSALIAEVAAERAAAEALATQGIANEAQQQQPSLGSPLEALSSPAGAIAAQAPAPPPQLLSLQAAQSQFQAASAPTFSSQIHQSIPATQSQQQRRAPAPAPAQQQQHQAQPAIENPTFIAASQAEEPMVAPSFEQVLNSGCPHKGVYSWENKDHCDRYYMCTNGTFTEEACPNGLAYSQMGAVYQHCAYNWNVDCGRKKSSEPIASPGCPWQFGIFPILQNGRCSIDYYNCEWGVPEPKRCSPEGLLYDDRIKGCQWADQLGCKSEALLNFKCPAEDEDNPYWPYPRYYHNTQDVIVCVNEQPRLVHCNEDQLVDPSSLSCVDVKKKKKF